VNALALGRYRLQHRLGVGSVGSVFGALDERTGREVVVKLFDGVPGGYREWLQELRLALRLRHPHIVRCLDGGQDESNGLMTLVFERAHGGSCRRRLVEQGAFDEASTWALLEHVSSGLAEAHQQGVMHRDVKPENVLWEPGLGWQVTDFGVGRHLSAGDSAKTLVGSVEYMAPEVAGGAFDFSVDQFSLGVLGHEALTGVRLDHAGRAQFVAEARADLGLKGVLARLLSPQPRGRFPDMAAVRAVVAARGLADFEARPAGTGWPWRVGEFLANGARLVGAERFVHSLDAAVPAIVARQRVVALDDLRKSLFMSNGGAVVSVRAEFGQVWVQDAGRLTLVEGGRVVASGELELGPGLCLQPATNYLVAARGSQVCAVARRGPELVGRWQDAPGPVTSLGYVGGDPVAIGGDAQTAWTLVVGAQRASERAVSVDLLSLSFSP
jgi:hypothetical protein